MDFISMITESRNVNSFNLHRMSTMEILKLMNKEDENIPKAIKLVLPNIEKIVERVISSFEKEGRLIYVGAGTSGRLGVLDAVECPPTFGTEYEQVVGLIAGGEKAFVKAVEGAEDSGELAIEELKAINVNNRDTVVGIAASGRTPYVQSALKYARSIGASTAAISCNENSPISKCAEIFVEVILGPEILTGSTRLKAGTAQKLILNMISTASMVGIGKVYENLMVDVQQTNEKLKKRAENIVMEATGVEREIAKKKLKEAGGSAKLAIVMILLNCNADKGMRMLQLNKGHIKNIID